QHPTPNERSKDIAFETLTYRSLNSMWSLRSHWRPSPRKQPTASQHLSDFRFFGAQLVSRVQQALPINRMPVAPAPVAQAGYINRLDGAKNVVQQFNSRNSREPSIFPGA